MGNKRGFMKKSPLWMKFFSVSLLLMFLIILGMTTVTFLQMRNKETRIVESNISDSIYYMERNLENSLLWHTNQIGGQKMATGFYNMKKSGAGDYRSQMRAEVADICNTSSDVFAVFYQDNNGECYSAGEIFWSINSQLELIAECKQSEYFSKGNGLWRYASAGRGRNALVWCKDMVYVDSSYRQIELGTMLLYLDTEQMGKDFFSENVQTYTVVCDSLGTIAIAQDESLIGKPFDSVFSCQADGSMKKGGVSYLFSEKDTVIDGWKVYSYIEMDMTGRNLAQTMTSTIVIACIGLLAVFAISYVLSKRIGRPIEELLKYIKINRYGEITEMPEAEEGDIAKIRRAFEEMSADLRKNIESNYEMQLMLKEITIKVYESQMNPHFLFNTLQMIQMMNIMDEKQNVIEITNRLGELLRFNLDSRNEVELSEEIENVINYLKIMELRFKGRFNYKILIPDELMDCYTIKFMLQPLIENAVSHGFVHKTDMCEIVIMAQQIGDEIAIIVKDNGQGIEPGHLERLKKRLQEKDCEQTGIGIVNVHERIGLIYGEQYGIDLFSHYQKDTNVLIHIPVSRVPRSEVEKDV